MMRILDWILGANGGATHSRIRKTMRREPFSDFFPWVAFDSKYLKYLISDETKGYLWECSPVAFAGGRDVKTFDGILRISFPKNTILQVILYADPDISDFVDRFKKNKIRNDKLANRNVQEYAGFLLQGTKGLDQLNGIPLRNYRCFIALKSDQSIDADDLATIEESLHGIGMNPRILRPPELLRFMRRLLNKHVAESHDAWDENVPIKRQILFSETGVVDNADSLFFGNNGNGKYVRCLTPKTLPKDTDPLQTNSLCGGIHGVMEDTSQITTPFIWSLNIIFDDSLKSNIHSRASMTMMQQASGSFAVQIQKRNEEYTWALNELDNQRFVKIMPSLVIFADSESELRVATARARRIWEGQNYIMQEETILRRAMFLVSLPFGLYGYKDTLKVLDRDFPVPASVATRMLPVQADFRGTLENPVLSYIGRKGQVIGIDVFDKRSNNHNFLVTAGSGAGKSFSLNCLAANYYAANAKIRIVDLGYSYEKLCRSVNGRFMDFGKERVTINPFDSCAEDAEDRDHDAIATTAVIAEMVYSASKQDLTEVEWTLIKEAVRWAYNTDPINGVDAVSRFLSEFPDHAEDHMHHYRDVAQASAKRMAFNLADFTKDGLYGRFFNGESTFRIADDDFVVLELERLKPQKELFRVITMQVLNAITQDLYLSDRGNQRFILFEEAWSFFDSGNRIGTLIEEGYRRARKYYGSFGIVTQSYLDLEKFGKSGDVIRANAAYKFLMESEDYVEAAQKSLLDFEGLALDLLAGIKNNKPRYSELFLDTPYGKGPARLVVDPWNYWVATSAGDDVNRFMSLLAETGDVVEVIETLSGKKA